MLRAQHGLYALVVMTMFIVATHAVSLDTLLTHRSKLLARDAFFTGQCQSGKTTPETRCFTCTCGTQQQSVSGVSLSPAAPITMDMCAMLYCKREIKYGGALCDGASASTTTPCPAAGGIAQEVKQVLDGGACKNLIWDKMDSSTTTGMPEMWRKLVESKLGSTKYTTTTSAEFSKCLSKTSTTGKLMIQKAKPQEVDVTYATVPAGTVIFNGGKENYALLDDAYTGSPGLYLGSFEVAAMYSSKGADAKQYVRAFKLKKDLKCVVLTGDLLKAMRYDTIGYTDLGAACYNNWDEVTPTACTKPTPFELDLKCKESFANKDDNHMKKCSTQQDLAAWKKYFTGKAECWLMFNSLSRNENEIMVPSGWKKVLEPLVEAVLTVGKEIPDTGGAKETTGYKEEKDLK